MAEFNPGAFGLASLMLTAQLIETLKRKDVLSQDDVVQLLNTCLAEFRKTNTASSNEAGALLLQFYNAVPDVSLLVTSESMQ